MQMKGTCTVLMGHWKPGKSLNSRISFSRPGKSWNLIVGLGKSFKVLLKDHGKSWNLKSSEEYEPWMKFCTVKRYDLQRDSM